MSSLHAAAPGEAHWRGVGPEGASAAPLRFAKDTTSQIRTHPSRSAPKHSWAPSGASECSQELPVLSPDPPGAPRRFPCASRRPQTIPRASQVPPGAAHALPG
eukprot:9502207-Pyramimonas_sp.AAC.1